MVESLENPTQLTRQGVKRICEATNLGEQLKDVSVVLQILEVSIFADDDVKKNIKVRLTLSDGVSKVMTLMIKKAYDAMVSTLNPSPPKLRSNLCPGLSG